MTERSYPMVVQEISDEEGGGFIATAPDLIGCMGSGDTAEEAIDDLRNAIAEWKDEAIRLDREVPEPGSVKTRVRQKERAVAELIQAYEDLVKAQDRLMDEQKDLIRAQMQQMDRIRAKLEFAQTQKTVEAEAYSWVSGAISGKFLRSTRYAH